MLTMTAKEAPREKYPKDSVFQRLIVPLHQLRSNIASIPNPSTAETQYTTRSFQRFVPWRGVIGYPSLVASLSLAGCYHGVSTLRCHGGPALFALCSPTHGSFAQNPEPYI
jgi:hypothetical protein